MGCCSSSLKEIPNEDGETNPGTDTAERRPSHILKKAEQAKEMTLEKEEQVMKDLVREKSRQFEEEKYN